MDPALVDAPVAEGTPALTLAVHKRYDDLVDLLIQHHANVNATTRYARPANVRYQQGAGTRADGFAPAWMRPSHGLRAAGTRRRCTWPVATGAKSSQKSCWMPAPTARSATSSKPRVKYRTCVCRGNRLTFTKALSAMRPCPTQWTHARGSSECRRLRQARTPRLACGRARTAHGRRRRGAGALRCGAHPDAANGRPGQPGGGAPCRRAAARQRRCRTGSGGGAAGNPRPARARHCCSARPCRGGGGRRGTAAGGPLAEQPDACWRRGPAAGIVTAATCISDRRAAPGGSTSAASATRASATCATGTASRGAGRWRGGPARRVSAGGQGGRRAHWPHPARARDRPGGAAPHDGEPAAAAGPDHGRRRAADDRHREGAGAPQHDPAGAGDAAGRVRSQGDLPHPAPAV